MLTATECKNARCPEGKKWVRLSDGGGLYLEVWPAGPKSPEGMKAWRWKFRHEGKEKRLALGTFPAVSLAEARSRRDAARRQLDAGTDPAAARKAAKAAPAGAAATTFEAVARRWWAEWASNKNERHAGYALRRLELDAFPVIGARQVAELTAPQLVAMAKRIEARGAGELARRLLATCGQVLRWAVAHGLAERNAGADVKPGDVLKPRDVENHARIGAAELPELLRKVAAYEGSAATRFALQLLALTFVRTQELTGARWGEFDLQAGEWRIPAERMKRRRLHVVPLSRQAVELLETWRTARGEDRTGPQDLLFPGERDHAQPMSSNTMLFALYRMGYRGRMTGHGFRGLASTVLNEMGHRADVIEAQLAHVEGNKVRAAYNHAQYLPERHELMQAWADYMEAARDTGKVVPFRRARRSA